jgi:cytidylate kinase
MQQQAAESGGIVMDGRDIGSAVLPNAELKIFMTADKDIRVQRRYSELKAKGEDLTLEQVETNLVHRDKIDTTRKENPLIQVKDARVLDNSSITEEEQLKIALSWAEEIILE